MKRRTFLGSAAVSAALSTAPRQAPASRSDGSLKITGFKIHKATVRWRSLLFLEIETDGGITGIGEGSIYNRVDEAEASLRWLEPHFVGKDPTGIEKHWDTMYYRLSRWRGGPVLQGALSAVDIALWDLEGKRLGVPVWRLLGGPLQTSMRAYHSHVNVRAKDGSPQALADAVLEAKALGWWAVKWGVQRSIPENAGIREAVAKAAAVRRAVGDDFEFGMDFAERCITERSALRFAHALAPYNPLFMEEPTWRENPGAMTELARKSPVPIATGEGLITVHECKQVLDAKGAEIIQPDVLRCGGITNLRKMADLAEVYGVEIAPHQCKGPVAHVASLTAMANSRNFLIHEWEGVDDPLYQELTDGSYPTQKNGMISLPAGPGLGITVNFEEFKRRFPYNREL